MSVLAMGFPKSPMPALAHFIIDVLLIRSCKKVVRIDTPWIIALVENVLSVGDWAIEKNIRKAMRFLKPTTNANHSIALAVFGAKPIAAPAVPLRAIN